MPADPFRFVLAPMSLSLCSCAATPSVTLGSTDAAPAPFFLALGERSPAGAFSIEPVALIEDSRCPAEVQCVQAGTVRLRVRVQRPPGEGSEITLGAGDPAPVGDAWLHLTGVCPYPRRPGDISSSDYRFAFAISEGADPEPVIGCGA